MILQKSKHGEFAIIFLLALVPITVKIIYFPQYPGTDDAFIHATLVKNILSGNGWAINPHYPVNMSTSPLFTLLLSGVAFYSQNILTAGMIFSSMFSIATILMTYLITQILFKSSTVRIVVVMIAAFNVHFWRWNGTVMETTLAMFFVVLIVYFYIKFMDNLSNRRIVGLALIHAFAILTRPEMILLLLAMIIFVYLNTSLPLRSFVPKVSFGIVLFMLPWLVFSALYFHSIIPSTYYAKTTSFHLVNWSVSLSTLQVLFSAYGPAIVISFSMAIMFLYRIRMNKQVINLKTQPILRIVIPILSFPILVFIFYYFKTTHLQSSARYLLPSLCVIPFLCGYSLELSLEFLSKRIFFIVILILCLLQVMMSIFLNQTRIIPVLSKFQDNYVDTMTMVISYLSEQCKPKDNVLVEIDIGVISYYCNSNFIIRDGGALASPELIGLTLRDKIDLVQPRYVVQTLGIKKGELITKAEYLKLVFSKVFASHGIKYAENNYWCNIYEVTR